ncbi:MAG: YceI family protein [bacterium]|nr:YceI family protein [bacterium]
MKNERRSVWPILAGLLAGSVAAVTAALVSLPLRSPDDLFANSASVTFAALLIGLAGGVLWRNLYGQDDARRRFRMYAAGGFIASFVILAILESTVLDRFISFGVPLAAIIFITVGLLTPVFTEMSIPQWTPLAAIAAAIVVGGAMAGIGDGESGDLSLDDIPVLTAAPDATTSGPPATAGDGSTQPPAGGPLSIPADLPSQTFSFATGTATWAVPETFTAGGLEVTAVGRSEDLSGRVVIDGLSEFTVDLTTFVSDQTRRDNIVHGIFEADPIAIFTTTELVLPALYTEGEVYSAEISGEMTINGVTNQVTWAIDARLVGTQLDVTGALDIVLTDFDVEPPSNASVTVVDSARLEILFSAIAE